MVYAATSRAMAVLETLIHLELDMNPTDYLLCPIEIPDELIGEMQSPPENWNMWPHQNSSRHAGDRWVRANSSAALRVPSAVLAKEHNILLNPNHPEFRRVKAHQPESNFLDPRLFR
jgi:RES domain-containing protein